MNTDVTGWDTSKVQNLDLAYTFKNAAAFKGVGLHTWRCGDAVRVDGTTFSGAISIPACTKYHIYTDWPNTNFKAAHPTWSGTSCPTVKVDGVDVLTLCMCQVRLMDATVVGVRGSRRTTCNRYSCYNFTLNLTSTRSHVAALYL